MEKKLLHLMFGDDPVSVVESACLRLCYEQDPNCPLINIGHLALYLDCSMDVQVILRDVVTRILRDVVTLYVCHQ